MKKKLKYPWVIMKIKRTIQSCVTLSQLRIAEKYCYLLINEYTKCDYYDDLEDMLENNSIWFELRRFIKTNIKKKSVLVDI